MKKRLMSAVIAAVVLMALFAACGEEVQTVASETANQVGDITVTQLAKNCYVLISWDAVEDGTGYQVYCQQEGKKSVIELDWGWQWNTITNNDPEDEYLDYKAITDPDKWCYPAQVKRKRLDGPASDPYISYIGKVPTGRVRFGVQTYTANPNKAQSEIKWSDYKDIAAPKDVDNTY